MLNTCLAHKSDAVFNVSNHNTGNMTIGKLGLKKLKNNKQCNNMKFSIIDDFSLILFELLTLLLRLLQIFSP